VASSNDRFDHDPQARLDYGWDWASWLGDGETITAHTVTASGAGGVVVESSAVIGGQVVAWISGGVVARQSSVTVHIVTSEGRADDRTLRLDVKER